MLNSNEARKLRHSGDISRQADRAADSVSEEMETC